MAVLESFIQRPLRGTRRLAEAALRPLLTREAGPERFRRPLLALETVRRVGLLDAAACDRIEDRLLRGLVPAVDTAASAGQASEPASLPAAEAAAVAEHARRALATLTVDEIETVLAVEARDPGWQAAIQAVELRCVPRSTDILSIYEIDLDRDGRLRSARRTARMQRNQTL